MPSGGSHPRYARDLRALVEANIEADIRSIDIARSLRVSTSFVCQLRSHYEAFGTVSPPPLGVQGRPLKIHKEAEEGIINFLEEYPTARRDDIYDFLFNEYDIHYNIITISDILK